MTYPKTVAEVTEYSIDERGIKRITFQTAQDYAKYIMAQPSNVYLIEGQDKIGEIETLLGCMEIENKDPKALEDDTWHSGTMEYVKDLVANFFKDGIPTSKILEYEFQQRAEDLAAGKTGIYALDNEEEGSN